MFVVYIFFSNSRNKYYVGHTANLNNRLLRHNQGRSKATKSGIPWQLVLCEKYNTKSEAYQREMVIKRKKSKIFIQNLIKSTG